MAYPERQSAPPGGLDRLLMRLDFAAHGLLHRRLAPPAPARAAAASAAPARELARLRYELRRTGPEDTLLAECFALFGAASPAARAAAARLVRGGIVELFDDGERRRALELAAFVLALLRGPVHLVCATQVAAEAAAASLRERSSGIGLEVGCILPAATAEERRAAWRCPLVCVTAREAALDYLRDRSRFGGRPGGLRGALARLADAASPAQEEPLLSGLHCALVAEADRVLLDDAHSPHAIARDVDVAEERLLYDQALELARTLRPDEDFAFGEEGARLSDTAADRIGALVAPLGGVWGARERREELLGLALEALHALQRDVDYQVDQGRVLFPPKPPQEAELSAERDAVLLKLVEAKEGCRFSARRELVARISTASFFGRYLHLAGACKDARGLAADFRALYSAKVYRAGERGAEAAAPRRLFVTAEAKRAAWLAAARAAPGAVKIAVRTPAAARGVQAVLAGEGLDERASVVAAAEDGAPAAGATLLVVELQDARRHVAALLLAHGAARAQVVLSLEDEALAALLGPGWRLLARRCAGADGEVAAPWGGWIARLAERRAEAAQRLLRQDLAAREQHLRDLLAFSGEGD
jgi:preprotein translocase subunit SecA